VLENLGYPKNFFWPFPFDLCCKKRVQDYPLNTHLGSIFFINGSSLDGRIQFVPEKNTVLYSALNKDTKNIYPIDSPMHIKLAESDDSIGLKRALNSLICHIQAIRGYGER